MFLDPLLVVYSIHLSWGILRDCIVLWGGKFYHFGDVKLVKIQKHQLNTQVIIALTKRVGLSFHGAGPATHASLTHQIVRAPFIVKIQKREKVFNRNAHQYIFGVCFTQKSNHQLLDKTHITLYYPDQSHSQDNKNLRGLAIMSTSKESNRTKGIIMSIKGEESHLTLSQSLSVLPLTLNTFFP